MRENVSTRLRKQRKVLLLSKKEMNVLLLGSGGREHALSWKISKSDQCENLFIAPGNAGTEKHGTNVDLANTDFEAIDQFCKKENIEMIVVGPEDPLVRGIVDFFQNKDIKVVGPAKLGAQLEGSKAFAKDFMARYNIPTALYKEFTRETLAEGLKYLDKKEGPFVLKADGLAAGKGVIILQEKVAAKAALKEMLNGQFGQASEKVVIEDFLDGIEFSVFVLTDGKSYKVLPEAKDYKKIGEGDKGLNTGGMGAISPVPFVDQELWKKVEKRIIIPTIDGIQKDNLNYKGFVFIGLIMVGGDPFVIEYNCRMGDPETEVVIPRLKNDLLDLFESLFDGSLAEKEIKMEEAYATTVMLVSGGYPESYEKGKEITGVERIDSSMIFFAGAKKDASSKLVTSGGRVMAVTSMGKSMEEALKTSYGNIEKIKFDKMNYRKDIGFDL